MQVAAAAGELAAARPADPLVAAGPGGSPTRVPGRQGWQRIWA